MKKLLATLVGLSLMLTTLTACNTDDNTSSVGSSSNNESSTEEVKNEPLKIGETGESKNIKLTLQAAKQYEKITGDSEFIVDEPDSGKNYLILTFEAENISSENYSVNTFYFSAYADGYAIDQTIIYNQPDGLSSISTNLAAGKKAKGFVAYQVDPSWKEFEISYSDSTFSNNSTVNFRITPDDITK